jgi:hypothetical protein
MRRCIDTGIDARQLPVLSCHHSGFVERAASRWQPLCSRLPNKSKVDILAHWVRPMSVGRSLLAGFGWLGVGGGCELLFCFDPSISCCLQAILPSSKEAIEQKKHSVSSRITPGPRAALTAARGQPAATAGTALAPDSNQNRGPLAAHQQATASQPRSSRFEQPTAILLARLSPPSGR